MYYICEICEENNCVNCTIGNPCWGCEDYDAEKCKCVSDGACGMKQFKENKKCNI